MAGKTPYEANKNFIKPIRLSLSCLTKSQILESKPDENGLRALDAEPFSLKSEPRYYLLSRIHYTITKATGERGPFKALTEAYNYLLQDRNGGEILAFHWHPRVGQRLPHLHLYKASGATTWLIKKHIPTNRISLEEVIRFLIEELNVKAIREDWDQVLKTNYAKYKRYRMWG